MNPEVKQKWVDALRSGHYEQGAGFLHKGDAFCCLGVLCDLAVEADVTHSQSKNSVTYYGDTEQAAALPEEVIEWADLSTGDPVIESDVEREKLGFDIFASLSDINDLNADASFEHIADLIEEYL